MNPALARWRETQGDLLAAPLRLKLDNYERLLERHTIFREQTLQQLANIDRAVKKLEERVRNLRAALADKTYLEPAEDDPTWHAPRG